ncbi:glycosyltransferase family 4 protein [bacterium]|nr:glycosyltransferase family 4 protein [bacterium]
MKIVFISVTNLENIGGVKSYIDSLVEAYRSLGHQVRKISPGSLPFLKKVKNKAMGSPREEKIGQYKLAARLVRFLSSLDFFFQQPDIVFFQDVISFNEIYPLLNKKKTRSVLVVHTYLADEAVANRFALEGSKTHQYLISQEISAYKAAPLIFTVDKRIKAYIMGKIGNKDEAKIFDWINFVDVNKFRPVPERKKKIVRQKLGLPLRQKIILCPRKLNMKNGVTYAVQAMAFLPSQFLLVVCGDGPERKAIEGVIKKQKLSFKVRLLGDVDSSLMPNYFEACDYVVIPSIHIHGMEEATSIAGLEAQASGRPLIASKVGGLKQIIEDKKTGILVEEKSPREIAEAILLLEKNPLLREHIAQQARKAVKEHNSHYKRSKEFLAVVYQKKK